MKRVQLGPKVTWWSKLSPSCLESVVMAGSVYSLGTLLTPSPAAEWEVGPWLPCPTEEAGAALAVLAAPAVEPGAELAAPAEAGALLALRAPPV